MFEIYVSRHLLIPGQDTHQLVRFSVWHKLINGNIELGSCEIPVRELHNKYYLNSEQTEITIPIKSGKKGTSQCFNSFIVASITFQGDWSANLQVEHQENVKRSNELKMKEADATKGIIEYVTLFSAIS